MQARKIGLFTLTTTLLWLIPNATAAQEPPVTRKQELVRELIVVMGMKENASKTVDAILDQMRKQYPQTVERLADTAPDLTPAQRQNMKANVGESYIRFSKNFQERLQQRVDIGKITEEIAYELYARYFTEEEIKDLISFYKTPTGKKALSTMPQLLAESMQKAGEKLSPILTDLIIEILGEEKERIKRGQ